MTGTCEQIIPCGMEDIKMIHTTGNVAVLPAMILERPDIALVVTATPGCILGVYHTVKRLGKLGQTFWCEMNPEDYAAGGDALRAVLGRAAETPGVAGIVIYASCFEYVLGYDFSEVIRTFDNPGNIPVKVLLRGPVVPGSQKSPDHLRELLGEIPPSDGRIERENTDPLPEMPGFIKVADSLQGQKDASVLNILIEAGGCTKCLERPDEDPKNYRLRTTRLAAGRTPDCWRESIRRGVLREIDAHPEVREVNLIGSSFQRFIGMSLEELLTMLEDRGLTVHTFEG